MTKQKVEEHYNIGTTILSNLPQSSRILADLGEAVKHLQRATELDPSSAFAFHNLAHAWYNVAEYTVAASAMQQWRVNPKKTEESIRAALRNALAAADRALAIQRQFPQAHNTRAMVLAKLLRLDEAMQATDVALLQDPAYEHARENRQKIAELIRQRAQTPGYQNEAQFRKEVDKAIEEKANLWKRLFKRH